MITKFSDMYASLKGNGICKRMVVAWATDGHTIGAAALAVDKGFITATLVGDERLIREVCDGAGISPDKFTIVNEPDEAEAVRRAVKIVRAGEGDFLMKGLCSTDKFLRAVLDKEKGLLPPKGLLLHVGVMETPHYHKLLFMGDMAVIPLPDFRQKQTIAKFVVEVAHSFGVTEPKVAFIAASEQVLDSMPACMEAAALAKMADRGQIKGCIADGPLALDVAIDKESVEIKHLSSKVAGDADCLVFPNLESSNVFWKTNSKLSDGVQLAGMLVGTTVPCVLASRADSIETKLNSIAEAVMFVNGKTQNR